MHRRRHGRGAHGRALSKRCPAINQQHWEDSNARGTHHGWNGRLGQSISTKMHAAGYRVVVTHSPGNTRVKDWLAEHSAAGRQFSAYGVDVADFDSCKECVARVTKGRRAHRHSGQQCRDNEGHDVQKDEQGGLGCGHPHQSRLRLQYDQASHGRHDRSRLGPRHQRVRQSTARRVHSGRPTIRPPRPACTASPRPWPWRWRARA